MRDDRGEHSIRASLFVRVGSARHIRHHRPIRGSSGVWFVGQMFCSSLRRSGLAVLRVGRSVYHWRGKQQEDAQRVPAHRQQLRYSAVLAFKDAPKSSRQPRTDEHLRLIRTAMRQLEDARTGGKPAGYKQVHAALASKGPGPKVCALHGSWHTTARTAASQTMQSERRRIERVDRSKIRPRGPWIMPRRVRR